MKGIKHMKSHIKSHQAFQTIILIMWVGLFMLFSCEPDYPDKIYDPDYEGTAYPVINRVDPPVIFYPDQGIPA
jgi:hypothetical protein